MFGPLRPLRASRTPLAAPPGALAAHPSLGRRQAAATEAPRSSACLPTLAHTGRLALASRAGMRTRPLRDAAVADLRVAEGPPGDLAGALALARTEASAPPPAPTRRARRAAPGLEGPTAVPFVQNNLTEHTRRGAGPSGPPRAWRRPASPRRRGRGRRRPARARAPSWPGASRGRASPTRSRAGWAPPWSWRRPPSRRARPGRPPRGGRPRRRAGPSRRRSPPGGGGSPRGSWRRARRPGTPRSRGPRASRGRRPRRRRRTGPASIARGASRAASRRARAACRACPPSARPGPAASARGTTGPVWPGNSARLVRLALPSHSTCVRLACLLDAIPGPPAARPSRPFHHGVKMALRLRICHILPCFSPARGAAPNPSISLICSVSPKVIECISNPRGLKDLRCIRTFHGRGRITRRCAAAFPRLRPSHACKSVRQG